MAKSSPLQFSVPGIAGQANEQAITKAVRTIDPDATVSVDAGTGLVVIGGEGEPHDFMQALEAAGFEVKAA